ncbi:NAD-dependent epimerase/dehydratase family protein [Vagococcus elongatus]|uniref:UDP-glucose 4-epimerase n=1 Tax=Vagococcus elongatus TaxID=180344 RepID=A0A430AQ26_9ENTE|nr:NAD-dependent epimerase/dehydratase family protein [Vagococcus elongatus]RSU09997.1 UDP-glucose 4-epimerase [Vagococcus elongatus]
MKKIFVTGSLGQIGSELIIRLRQLYGVDNVLATDIREDRENAVCTEGHFIPLDVLDKEKMGKLAHEFQADTMIHLASLLSSVAEDHPQDAWRINMDGLMNALEVARKSRMSFFTPSSIGAFGPDTPKEETPQDTLQRPTTMYGITKVAGELLCDYYHAKYALDTRGVRFPGLISYETLPGGGTTDYAVEIFYEAIKYGHYTCPIKAGTYMDMMYMPDAIEAIIQLMEADPEKLIHRNAFNISSMSFDPEDIKQAIQKFLPEFTMDYHIDPKLQQIADSWPDRLDCQTARNEWSFKPAYDLETMTQDMLEKLKRKINTPHPVDK